MRLAHTTLLILALAGACVSPPGGAGGDAGGQLSATSASPARVSLIQYTKTERLNLVNEAHTDPVEYYSQKRPSASTKITSNEVLTAMLDYFNDLGFAEHAVEGYAPRVGAAGEVLSIEVETQSGVRHLMYAQGQSQPALRTFVDCQRAWLEIYNLTQQAQVVSNSGGDLYFENQKAKIGRSTKKR